MGTNMYEACTRFCFCFFANVEIKIHLPNGVSPDKTIDALFAFTAQTPCEANLYDDPYQYFGMLSAEMHLSINKMLSPVLFISGPKL